MSRPAWAGVVLAEARPAWFDPHNQIAGAARVVSGNITPGLLCIGARTEPAAELAHHWYWRSERELVLDLTGDRRFSSGRPVDARAVAENLDAVAVNRALFNRDENALIAATTAETADRVVIALRRAFPPLPGMLANALGMVDLRDGRSGTDHGGAGPYRVCGRTRHSVELASVSSPERRVSWRFASTPDARRRHVLDRSADVLLGSAGAEHAAEHGWTVHAVPAHGPAHLAFNVRRAPMSDLRFRQRVAGALDRDSLMEEGFGGRAEAGDQPYPTTSVFHLGEARPVIAGQPTDPEDASTRRPLLLAVGGSAFLPLARAVARQVHAALGFLVRVVSVANERWWPEYYLGGEWDLAVQAWTPMPDPHFVYGRRYASWGVHNATGYASPALDRAVRAALTTTDPQERLEHYRTAEQRRKADLPTVYLGFPHRVMATRPGVVPPVLRPSWDVVLTPSQPSTDRSRMP